jgi:hypothetical protein
MNRRQEVTLVIARRAGVKVPPDQLSNFILLEEEAFFAQFKGPKLVNTFEYKDLCFDINMRLKSISRAHPFGV